MQKETLLIVSTHGDEKIGLEAIEQLKKKKLDKFFDYIIANPKANMENKRFIEKDLNRSYPGNKKSKYYEEKLAYKNYQIALKYKYIIDIHEANEGINDFMIVARNDLGNLFPYERIDLKTILLWPDPKGPLCGELENAIELEFGMKNRNRKKIVAKASLIIENFLKCKKIFKIKSVYKVYGFLPTGSLNQNQTIKLVDFKQTKVGNEKFYPLLVNQYLNLGIKCYKMIKNK